MGSFDSDSTVHRVGYMFVAFSHLTDGDVDDKEMTTLAGILWAYLEVWKVDLTGDGVVDIDDVCKLIDDDIVPFYNTQDVDSRIDYFVATAVALKNQDWWTNDFADMLLEQLKKVAMADGNYHEGEKVWIEALSDAFGVGVPA